jgi:hypothetical protein
MITPGINMEFIRCEDKSFTAGVERARGSDIGTSSRWW